MAILKKTSVGDVQLLEVDADPSGAITADAASLAFDSTSGIIYRNHDGATGWYVVDDENTAIKAHAANHKDGGGDEVATATPAANAIPKADGAGLLSDDWIPGMQDPVLQAAPVGGLLTPAGSTLDVTANPGFDFTTTAGVSGHGAAAGITVLTEETTDGVRGGWVVASNRPTVETLDDEDYYLALVVDAATQVIVQGTSAPDAPTPLKVIITTPARDLTGPYTMRFLEGSWDDPALTPVSLTGLYVAFNKYLVLHKDLDRGAWLGPIFGLNDLPKPLAVAGGNAGNMTGADKTKLDGITGTLLGYDGSGNADFSTAALLLRSLAGTDTTCEVLGNAGDSYLSVSRADGDKVTVKAALNAVSVDAVGVASVAFNSSNADVDHQFKGTGDSNLLYVDAGADYVGIGIAAPQSKLHVIGTLRIGSTTGSPYTTLDVVGSRVYWRTLSSVTHIHVNYAKYNCDFVIAGDNDANLFYSDAGQDAVGIGTATPDAVAKLQVDSTTKGFLPPRMTTAQRTAISAPPDGLLVYDTDTDHLHLRAAGAWVSIDHT